MARWVVRGASYDPENRLIFTNAGAVQYAYDAKNKRIWQGVCSANCSGSSWTLSAETITIFGANGKQLASYTPNPAFNNTTNQVGMTFSQQGARIYFGGKLVQYAANGLTPAVITDRSHDGFGRTIETDTGYGGTAVSIRPSSRIFTNSFGGFTTTSETGKMQSGTRAWRKWALAISSTSYSFVRRPTSQTRLSFSSSAQPPHSA
jgi:hypothetical protein